MAKKATQRKKGDPDLRMREAAMAFAAEGRWRDLSLSEIAERADVPIAQAYAIYPSRTSILRAQLRMIDDVVLTGTASDLAVEPARDRLFDVIMRRFDAMAPYKSSMATIIHDLGRDPLASLCALPGFRRSLTVMLEAAGLSSDGLRGLLRTKVLGALYLSTLRVWFRDESEDLSKTMASLDRSLKSLDRVARRCCGLRSSVRTSEQT
ncbi:MAG: hypothetical protein R3245_02855 [Kiloniellales bacterium]|nr:hypothetical protein [Kiloniellales bacterium]